MTVYTFRIGPYARDIYIFGTKRFTERDGYPAINPEYIQPVKEYAAKNYTQSQIDNALARTWINQQEYDETCALITEPVVLPTYSQTEM
jgi:hypothetical protein